MWPPCTDISSPRGEDLTAGVAGTLTPSETVQFEPSNMAEAVELDSDPQSHFEAHAASSEDEAANLNVRLEPSQSSTALHVSHQSTSDQGAESPASTPQRRHSKRKRHKPRRYEDYVQ